MLGFEDEEWNVGSLPRMSSQGLLLFRKSSLGLGLNRKSSSGKVLPRKSSLGKGLAKKSTLGPVQPKKSSLPVLIRYRKLCDLEVKDQVDSVR